MAGHRTDLMRQVGVECHTSVTALGAEQYSSLSPLLFKLVHWQVSLTHIPAFTVHFFFLFKPPKSAIIHSGSCSTG